MTTDIPLTINIIYQVREDQPMMIDHCMIIDQLLIHYHIYQTICN
jgi:hypothetical protein